MHWPGEKNSSGGLDPGSPVSTGAPPALMGRAEADQTVAHAHGLYGLYGLTGTGSTGFTGSRALLPHHYCIQFLKPQAA
jgi:hypothetical protein